MKKVLESYKGFEGIKRVVDVGGGLGININFITSKYPHIRGILKTFQSCGLWLWKVKKKSSFPPPFKQSNLLKFEFYKSIT